MAEIEGKVPMSKPSKPRKNFPYYKVHVYKTKTLSWTDARKKAFDTLSEAEEWSWSSLTDT
jgi:hypothetical protein